MEARFNAPIEEPVFGFTLRDDPGTTIFAATTDLTGVATGRFEAGETVVVRMAFDNVMTQSTYSVTPSIARAGLGADALDLRADLAKLVVHGGPKTGAVVNLPHVFEVTR
jgi:hypothetical protein